MILTLAKSKVHRCRITGADLQYEGSLTLDRDLMDAAGMLPWEQVQIVNVNNGERIETYLIPGERGSGEVILNGPAARKGLVGDVVIIITYAQYSEEEAAGHDPIVVKVDVDNRVIHAAPESAMRPDRGPVHPARHEGGK